MRHIITSGATALLPTSRPKFESHDVRRSLPAFAKEQLLHFLAIHGCSTIGAVIAIALLPWYWTGVCEIPLLLFMWILTGDFGISVGYHRLFTHRSFETTSSVRAALAIAGAMAGQGPVTYWVAIHRAHHMHSDHEGDPHSPTVDSDSMFDRVRAFCHGHFAWALQHEIPSPKQYAPDLLKDATLRKIGRLYPLWVVLGLLLPGLIGALLTFSWKGFVGGVLWGGFIRLAVVNHLIWAVNSIGHKFGRHDFDTGDNSRNNSMLATLTFGEGWHNTHHAKPHSARFSQHWWQIDIGYCTIRLLELLGLAWNVRSIDCGPNEQSP